MKSYKTYIWLKYDDGLIQQVEEEVAVFCPMIYREMLQKGMGFSKNYAIPLPRPLYPAILSLILDYCRFHQVPGRSNKERKSFDEKFIKLDTKLLCELVSAAEILQLKPLIDLTSRSLARLIEGKTPKEIRETFHLPDDLTEEEKLEPFKSLTDDPWVRSWNRLNAKKTKELKERQKLKDMESEEKRVDERSVDELLSFINGDGDSKNSRTAKHKKKIKRRKDQMGDHSGRNSDKTEKKEAATLPCTPSCSSEPFASYTVFEDAEIDDELDPIMKEELDREVEDFARRLNSDWPKRRQEISSVSK